MAIEFVPAGKVYAEHIITAPSVWPMVSDDHSGEFVLSESPLVQHLCPVVDGKPSGVWTLIRQSAAVMELHLVSTRGAKTGPILAALLDHIRSTSPEVSRLRAWVASDNRPAMVAARRHMQHIGTEPGAFLRFGKYHDLHLFGVAI
jgi:hypothetical protein